VGSGQVNENASIVTYEKAYFEKYSPVTLIDILERIPGVPDILNRDNNRGPGGGGQRGFGSGGDQILINSKRLSAKSSSIRDVLSRTPASQVERVELIRGAADGLDVQTEGLVVNVVLIEGADSSSLFWKLGGVYKVNNRITPRFELSYKGKTGKLDYTLTAKGGKNRNNFYRDEISFDANDQQTGTKDLDGEFRVGEVEFSTNLTYNFENEDVLNLNGSFHPIHIENDQFHVETGEDPETLFWDFEENFKIWEVGGDYTTDLGMLGKLKLLFLKKEEKNSDFNTQRFNGLGEQRYLYNDEIIEFQTSEEILRASLTKNLSSSQSLEFGGEGAFNKFRQKFDNFERDVADDPLELTTSNNIKIKENRFEIFAHHNYTISPKMVLQSSLTTEFSQIVADTILENGGINRENDKFTFFKPRINYRYDLSDRQQIRRLAEKKVSQLEFFHYMTYFDQQTKELKFGNTSIRPRQTWDMSATFEHRLPKDGGTLEAEISYKYHKDYITRIDFTEYEDFGGNPLGVDAFFGLSPTAVLRDEIDFTSKSGNIDKATEFGITLKSNTRLGFIGLPEAQLSLSYNYRKKRFVDPFTQTTRPFSWTTDHFVKIVFRHDVTKWRLSYGGEATFVSSYLNDDINYKWRWDPDNEFEAFVEYKIFDDIKLRIEASQGRNTHSNSVFYRYRDHVRFNELRGYDKQHHTRPYEIQFFMEGTF